MFPILTLATQCHRHSIWIKPTQINIFSYVEQSMVHWLTKQELGHFEIEQKLLFANSHSNLVQSSRKLDHSIMRPTQQTPFLDFYKCTSWFVHNVQINLASKSPNRKWGHTVSQQHLLLTPNLSHIFGNMTSSNFNKQPLFIDVIFWHCIKFLSLIHS